MLISPKTRNMLRLTAKATQFGHRTFTSWLIESAGTVPIKRRKDSPDESVDNTDVMLKLMEVWCLSYGLYRVPKGASFCLGSWNRWRCLFISRRNEQISSYYCPAQNRRLVLRLHPFILTLTWLINQLHGWFQTSWLGIGINPSSRYLCYLVQSLTCISP